MSISVTFKNRFKECVQEYCAGHGDCGSVRLAEKMGISYSVYSRILQYGILPKPDVLVRIADFSTFRRIISSEERTTKDLPPRAAMQRLRNVWNS